MYEISGYFRGTGNGKNGRPKMPRLRVVEPPQHGVSTGGPVRPKPPRTHSTSKPLGADRSSRKKTRGTTPRGHKRRTFLSPDDQACVILKYKELPTEKKERSKALRDLRSSFNISKNVPSSLVGKIRKTKKLPTRKHVGGRRFAVTPEAEAELIKVLKEHAYDLTFPQIQELTGIPATTAWRHMRRTKGWRVTSKSCRPFLTDANVEARKKWAEKHKKNKWKDHVDIDEKWFYVYSHSGKLKLPPGVDKPLTPIKSKRFIGKVMCLIAVARPSSASTGLIGCWRVTDWHTYKRRTTYRGTVYEAGSKRRVDANMDAQKWLQMMKEDVIPAIKAKAPGTKWIQWDNATPHTAENRTQIDKLLAKNKLTRVIQCPNSPDTNALDLGFNKSLDSRLPRVRSYDLDLFEQQIMDAFNSYPQHKLHDLFDMKSRICQCILECDPPGSNSFKLPHRRKESS